MRLDSRVLGIGREEETLLRAMERIRQSGYRDWRAYSPVPSDRLLKALPDSGSPIWLYTLGGCVIGFLTGLLLPIWSSLQWEMIVGGRPVVSIPPFLVIAFEMTMLLGGASTMAGLLIHARLARPAPQTPFAKNAGEQLSDDHFGIFVHCEKEQAAEVRQIILDAGMEEVFVEGG